MRVELTPEQRDRLLRMVDAEIAELGPEIHHTRTYKDSLKEQRCELRRLHDVLAAAGPLAIAVPASETSASEFVGTA